MGQKIELGCVGCCHEDHDQSKLNDEENRQYQEHQIRKLVLGIEQGKIPRFPVGIGSPKLAP